ncbi:MAG TPA: SDR family NAD(P)-dependent oxidoreductase [Steroidobacteraceae bacterium]|nr:SDR family NAD(P)-dependent oxidoreductase [Steroidobacteraceae bacterium]
MASATDRVILVTGASRGIGRGSAVALAAPGTTVYLSGRTTRAGTAALPGTIHETAAEIERRGARAVAVACDHCDDQQVAALFARIARECGRLDLLVNNATSIPDELVMPGGFWEKPLAMQAILDTGFRSHYVASWHAARMMVPRRSGLIAMVSSPGARCYMHGPAYGAGKAGTDKMAADMAVDLRKHQVAALSLWAPLTLTERSQVALREHPGEYDAFMANAVHIEFMGRLLDALLRDAQLMERSGKTWYAAELAAELGVRDLDGRQPPSDRALLGEPAQVSGAVIGG